MSKNRFEQVDEPQPDAITLALYKQGERAYAVITCPAEVSGGRLQSETTSEELPLKDGFRSVVRLANEIKAPIVVFDPDSLWNQEWGELFRV